MFSKLKKSLKEREDATNDILQFCSTATCFHNKYLSIHIKGVRDITKILLDALIEGGVYIAPEYYDHYKEKDKILAVSDENNKALKQLLGLSGEDIIRQ